MNAEFSRLFCHPFFSLVPLITKAKYCLTSLTSNIEDSTPVSFSLEHKQMLQQTKIILERGVVAIHPKFDKLITALRTAVEQDGSLDKEATSYPNIMDAFRLSLKGFRFGQRSEKPRAYGRYFSMTY
jgi:hypothetical protein